MRQQFNTTFAALICGGLLAALPPVAFAQDAKTEAPAVKAADEATPVSWTMQHKRGEKKQFRATATIVGNTGQGPITLVLKAVQKREISKVEPTGGLNWISTPVTQTLTFNDQEIQDKSVKFVTMTVVNDKGIVTDLKADASGQSIDTIQEFSAVMTSTPVPPKPVKVGDTWMGDFSGKVFKGRKFLVTYTYLGRETLFGKNTCKIKAQGDLPINTGEKDLAKMTGTLNIDPESGDAIHTAYKAENLDFPTPGGSALKVSVDSETTAIIPGVNDKEAPKKDNSKK